MRKLETKTRFAARKRRALRLTRGLAKLFPEARVFLDHRTPWELLVAVILSAQCTDVQVNKVTAMLFKKYRKFEDYLRASRTKKGIHKFETDIKSTGFYRAKTKNILMTANLIQERFGGKVPRTMDELISLRGVGRKTANIVLQNAFNTVVGIPVDTHVRRLARLHMLTDEMDPVKIEKDLCAVLPKREWRPFSYRLISYGRTFCPARKHNHAACPLFLINDLVGH